MKHTRDDILEAAVHLVDVEGVGVSTAQIAKAAGVSNGTLFHYFPTKQTLIDALYTHLKTAMVDAIGELPGAEPREQMHQIWLRWGQWAISHPAHDRVSRLLRDSGLASPEIQAKTGQQLAPLAAPFSALADAGAFVDLPHDYLAAVVIGQLEQATAMRLSPPQLEVAFDSAWRTIARPAAAER